MGENRSAIGIERIIVDTSGGMYQMFVRAKMEVERVIEGGDLEA